MRAERDPGRVSPPGAQSQVVGAVTAGTGAALIATAASACCAPVAAPLIVSLLGVSGAVWAAGLKPYSPYLVLLSAGFLAYGHWRIYRVRRRACEDGTCQRLKASPTVRTVLWGATVFWLIALVLNLGAMMG